MWEPFQESARQVVLHAQQEAEGLGHDLVGSEHLLLSLLNEEAFVRPLLVELKADPGQLREELLRQLSPGTPGQVEELTFARSAKRAIEVAFEESRSLGHSVIGAEHLLLGVMREEHGLVALVVRDSPLQLTLVREMVSRRIKPAPAPEPVAPVVDEVKAVVEAAKAESVALQSPQFKQEHLLLAMARDPASALCRALAVLGVDNASLTEAVVGLLAPEERKALLAADAAAVLQSAQQCASVHHQSLDPGHMLLALSELDCAAASLLVRLRVDLPGLREQARGELQALSAGDAEGYERVLRRAHQEAFGMGSAQVTSAHLLLSLLEEERGLPARLLSGVAFDLKGIRRLLARSRG